MAREREPWGGEVRIPRWLRSLLRVRPFPGTLPERAHERHHRQRPDKSVAQVADCAAVGILSDLYREEQKQTAVGPLPMVNHVRARERLGRSRLVLAGAIVVVGAALGRCLRAAQNVARAMKRPAAAPVMSAKVTMLAVSLVAVALLPRAPAFAQTETPGMDHHGMAGMLHLGNVAPYPTLREASRAHRREARKLHRATLRAAKGFDTLEGATRNGYVAQAELSPLYRPGLQHFRKHGVRSWGRVLYPRQPQALVFWCPSIGDCRLAGFMYRAAPRKTPDTYGGLLGWHRHSEGWSWMTHIWLTDTTRTSLAQCAPFNALYAHNPMLAWEPYQTDVSMIDEPCPDTAGLPGGSGAMPDMPMG